MSIENYQPGEGTNPLLHLVIEERVGIDRFDLGEMRVNTRDEESEAVIGKYQ